jgi:FkbM family methyltransferase
VNANCDFREKLLGKDLYHEFTARYAERMKKADPIVIWGGSTVGQILYDFFVELGVSQNIKYFADNDKNKWGTLFNGLPVVSAEEVVRLVRDHSDTCIVIASMYLPEIRKQLLSLGIGEKSIDVNGVHLAKNYRIFREKSAYEMIHSRFEDYEKVYTWLSDERSKAVYLDILNSKISLNSSFLEGIASPADEQYFDRELIRLGEHEVFCDCGSFNGDTLETFIALTGGKYRKYIAIEADKDNYAELIRKITEQGYKNIKMHNLACWNETTVLKFQPALTSGRVTDQGEVSVNADTLDNILMDEDVTFIKMDIEGAEEMALKGAGEVIRRKKPILAICLYHSLEDFCRLPLLIKEFNPDYRLHVRHYREMDDIETVCYAIPEDRWTL